MSTVEESPKTAVTVVERAALALGTSEHEKNLRELVAKSASITVIKNKDGREQCHSALMTLKTTRTSILKSGKAAREDATAFSKAVIAEERRLVMISEPEEMRLEDLRDAWDSEVAAKKIAKALVESQRITVIRQKIDAFRNTPQHLVGSPSGEIGAAAHVLSETVISLDVFQEYTGEAQAERDAAVKQLRTMQEAMRLHEEAQAELARKQAELVEQERLAAVARAAEEANARKVREAEDAERRAAQERAAEAIRVQQEEQEEHEAHMASGRAELAFRQAEIDRVQAEQERVAREAREAQEAEERCQREAAEATARAEAERVQAAKDAAEAAELAARRAAEEEAERRERVNFIKNGPAPEQIILALADEYRVDAAVARDWLALRDWKLVEVA